MSDLYGDGTEEFGGTVFRDVTLLALAGFITIVLLLLPWLNPIGEKESTTVTPPGSVIVELFWPDDDASDVDLWVKAPGDGAVGFSNAGGLFFNLLRDDRGTYRDATPINYEISYTRGISPGEHIVNVHLYEHATGSGPVPVTVAVSVVQPGQRARDHLFKKELQLDRTGQEITVARFSINRLGKLMAKRIHSLQKSLIDPTKRMSYSRQRDGTR